MSSAAPPANDAPAAPPAAGGRKKLLILAGAALAVLLVAGGAAGYFIAQQRKAAAAAAAEGDEVQEARVTKKDAKRSTPVFLPLDLFTVNLADREAERYAQVGVTLELADSKVSDQLKTYMPMVRNDILMLLAHKRADELQQREGKLVLAREIRRAASKPLDGASDTDGDADADEPVRAVHFSAFIIQ